MRTLFTSLLILLSTALVAQNYNINLLSNVPLPAGEEGNDIWGYVDGEGTEYAIIGSTRATYVYSLEDPSSPQLRYRVEGAQSTWRDIKDHNEYLYVTTDVGQDGLTVIDMSKAPDTITHSLYKPAVEVGNTITTLETAHNLYITDEGYLILAGANIFSGTPLFFDLNIDAEEPPFVGASRNTYAHDVFAENNLLYSSDIFAGELTVHDYSRPDSIYALGSARTTTTFTHNAWPTDDDSAVFTTDERSAAFVDAYDVRDPRDPIFLDKFRPDDSYTSGSIPHNTHVLGDFLATSWYRDGVVITDASRPHNMVETGIYDTYGGGGGGFDGCWGAYPFLPSGLLLASDINTGLYVFDANYVKGAYFEGVVLDSVTRQPLGGVRVNFDNRQAQEVFTDIAGNFATGIYEESTYPVEFTRNGYAPRTIMVTMERGVLNEMEVELRPLNQSNITVEVVDQNGSQINGAEFTLEYKQSVGANDIYDVIAGRWGYVTTAVRDFPVDPSEATTITVILQEGIYDDFLFDFDWQVNTTATFGEWERAVPNGTFNGSSPAQLGRDVSFDFGDQAFVTGNAGSTQGDNDVDNGFTSLTSPLFSLDPNTDHYLEFSYYFFNAGGGNVPLDDTLEVFISNGTERVRVFEGLDTDGEFKQHTTPSLRSFLPLTDEMTIEFVASDMRGTGHWVEALVDAVSINSVVRPQITFTPDEGCVPLSVVASVDGGGNSMYDWRVEGSTVLTATGANPTFAITEGGSYDVIVTIPDGQGGSSSFAYPAVINALPATVADFTPQISGASVIFENQSIGAQTATWDFGDGATSTLAMPSHTYAANGTYTVTLAVTGPCGDELVTKTVVIDGVVNTQDFATSTGISLLQNPVDEELTLVSTTSKTHVIQLFNMLGQRVKTFTISGNETTKIGVANLANGTYMLTTSDQSAGGIQVVVQH